MTFPAGFYVGQQHTAGQISPVFQRQAKDLQSDKAKPGCALSEISTVAEQGAFELQTFVSCHVTLFWILPVEPGQMASNPWLKPYCHIISVMSSRLEQASFTSFLRRLHRPQ